jgi:hypothetical protein
MEKTPAVAPALDDAPTLKPEAWWICIDCRSRIAPASARVDVRGQHVHEFTNPSAVTFVVRCFSIAPGARPLGERSTEWTWFPGHAWQIELCRRCAAHVGWSFHGASEFYGLIAAALAEES